MRNRDFDMIFCFLFPLDKSRSLYILFISFSWLILFLCIKKIFAKKSSPSVDSSWFIVGLWNRGLVSVDLWKPSSVLRQTAKRQQYQRLVDVPISVFEICMTQINKTGAVSNFSCSFIFCIALRMCRRTPLIFSFNE